MENQLSHYTYNQLFKWFIGTRMGRDLSVQKKG